MTRRETVRLDGLNHRNIASFVIEATNYLNQSGFNTDCIDAHYADKAIVHYRDRVPVGIITYVSRAEENHLFLKLGYVKEGFRQMHIYANLFAELKIIAKELKCTNIFCGIMANNFISKCAHGNLGFSPVGLTYQYKVIQFTDDEYQDAMKHL